MKARAVIVLTCALLAPQLLGPQAAAAPGDRAWLALGDSFSSGEGIPGTTTVRAPDGADCARANGFIDQIRPSEAKAYAVRAYEAVRAEYGFGSLDFVACTGAKAGDVETQIEEAEDKAGRTSWDIVSLSFGGNDLGEGDGGFGEIIMGCLDAWGWGRTAVRRPGSSIVLPPAGGCDITYEEAAERIDALVEQKLPRLYKRVAGLVRPGGDVIVVGYPQIFEEVNRWDFWRRNVLRNCEGIRAKDIPLLRRISDYLNIKIAEAVVRADAQLAQRGVRFHYVDATAALYEPENSDERHAVCSQHPWINGLTVGARSGDFRYQRTFHPNTSGHEATGAAVAALFGKVIRFDDVPVQLHQLTTGYAAVGPSGIPAGPETGATSASTNFWVGCEGLPAETYFGLGGAYHSVSGELVLAPFTPPDLMIDVRLLGDGRELFSTTQRAGQHRPFSIDVGGVQNLVLRAQAIVGVCNSAPVGYGVATEAVVS
jgi:hypothetical protein